MKVASDNHGELEATVDVPTVLRAEADYLIRWRGADVGEVRTNDILLVQKSETAEPGQYVIEVTDTGEHRLSQFEDGPVSGAVTGLMRRLGDG